MSEFGESVAGDEGRKGLFARFRRKESSAAERAEQYALEQALDSDVELEEAETHSRRPRPEEGPVDRATEGGFVSAQRCAPSIVVPTSHQTAYNAQETPLHTLELDHLFGCRLHDTRHALVYAGQHVVYPAGATAVALDPSTGAQRFFRNHDDEILCVAVHPLGELVATGSAGPEPAICVWNASTCLMQVELRGFHQRGVVGLAFDNTGERLASCGLDELNSVAVYDWASQRVVANAPGLGRVLVAGFGPSPSGLLVTGGTRHLVFWTASGATLTPREADYGLTGDQGSPTVTALGWHPDGTVLTGTMTGAIYRWRRDGGGCLWRCEAAHMGPVFDIVCVGSAIVSGGKDGRLLLWTPVPLKRTDCIDLRVIVAAELDASGRALGGSSARSPSIRSLCLGRSPSTLMVGTASGDAWEVDLSAPGSWRTGSRLLFSVHSAGTAVRGNRPPMPRSCALAPHPSELTFATVGEDATLRQWDCIRRSCTMRRPLPAAAVACAYLPPEGKFIAVGLADGRLLVLDAVSGALVAQQAQHHDAICVLSYAPSGRWLAAGCDDGVIDLYDAEAAYARVGTCVGHTAALRHVDFASDGQFLQSNSADGELLYWGIPLCEQIRFPAALKDTDWATLTCTLSWATQGIWPAAGSLDDVPACARSHARDILASVDDWGAVRLFRCPSDVGRASYSAFHAHGPRAAAVAFTFNDEYVISLGAGDRSVALWRHVRQGERMLFAEELSSDVEEEALAAPHARAAAARTLMPVPVLLDGYVAGMPAYMPAAAFSSRAAVAPSLGCQVESGAAWLPAADALFAPDGLARDLDALAPPAEALELVFAFGHSAGPSRGSLHALAADARVHPTRGGPPPGLQGVVGVTGAATFVYDKAAHTMHFCVADPSGEVGAPSQGHGDAILCCAAHPGGVLFATGEAGRFPSILVWSAAAPGAAPVARLPRGSLRRGVAALCFSRDGTLLVAADCAPAGARVALYRWAAGTLLSTAPAGAEAVLALAWSPFQDYFCSVGLRHCAFWAVDPLRARHAEFPPPSAAQQPGVTAAKGHMQSCLAACFPAPDASCVGTQDGSIFLFRGYVLAAAVPRAHRVTQALVARRDAVVSAGKEGVIRFWALDLSSCLRTLQLAHPLAFGACVKSLSPVLGTSSLLAGLRSGEVFEVDGATGGVTLLLQGHGAGGVRALATHPFAPLFVTGGGDGTLRVWDAAARRPLLGRSLALAAKGGRAAPVANGPRGPPLHALAWHPDGTLIAAGCVDGRLILLTADSLDALAQLRDRPSGITCLAFSPCGRYLAAGCGEALVDVYELDTSEGTELVRACVAHGHAAPVTAADWSADSSLLQTNGADGSLCFWEMPTGTRCGAAADARNADWASHTCTVSWATQGILPRPGGDAAPVAACDSAHARTCIVAGDAHGLVSLYQFPAYVGSTRRLFGGHSSRVNCVRFLFDDSHIVSAGDDGSLLLWRVAF